ncbi:MAG: clostripain-related cysteine peptidase [bacterium]|jgi:hypothetical protein
MLYLAASIFSGCGDGASTGPGDQEKAWTFMFYDQADAPLGSYDPMEDFCRRVASGSSVDFVVLRDTNGDSARIWHVTDAHIPALCKELGEVNMGDGHTLFDFIDYSKTHYPARRYVLAFYGHGGGWRGACFDRSSQYDALTMDEISWAVGNAGGVDLTVFTSNCFMGAVESAYELRNCTDIYVGSENYCGYAFWDAPMEDICNAMHADPDMSSEELARFIVDAVWARRDIWVEEDWYQNLTVSAVWADSLASLVQALDEVAGDYLSCPARLHARISWVYSAICMFGEEVVDVYHLAHCLLKVEDCDSTRTRLETVKERLLDCVLAERHDPVWSAYGLTVLLPYKSEYGYYCPEYGAPETALDFAEDTRWDELLAAYPYDFPDVPLQGPPASIPVATGP